MLSLDFLDDVRRMNKRQLYYQVLNFGMIVSSALMIWKGLMVVTGSESPIVVVLSGSMEPAFHRGDLLFLTNRVEDPIRVGEIVVFRIEGREIPIVHRVLKIHEKSNNILSFKKTRARPSWHRSSHPPAFLRRSFLYGVVSCTLVFSAYICIFSYWNLIFNVTVCTSLFLVSAMPPNLVSSADSVSSEPVSGLASK
ncbi:signal peptidase complex catalytic subunit SEC11A isoform X1 [Myotis lucifugus]|uniref:signal peptidase complex catalytic subunit SEC11A isoform X1 n=1 Tax=Myotis lucifugus TaxID=59463 RepID=UPI000CCC8C91|nr:signal peptidase complex catalytic subunit SEC11A isoform X1 [Myotis lucifugus]